jgi:hypothetical protein
MTFNFVPLYMFTLNQLSPEEKLQRYNEINSIPSSNAYHSYEPIPSMQEDPTPVVDFTSMAREKIGNNPLLFSNDKPLPKVSDQDIPGYKATPVLGSKNPYSKLVPFKSYMPTSNKLDFDDFEKTIRLKESEDDPKAQNPHSSAAGYYQFLWNDWKDSIKDVTGVDTVDKWKGSPDAQKKFFKFYYDNHIIPNVNKIKKDLGDKVTINDFDLAQLIHFRGAANARKLIETGQLNTKQESYKPNCNGLH